MFSFDTNLLNLQLTLRGIFFRDIIVPIVKNYSGSSPKYSRYFLSVPFNSCCTSAHFYSIYYVFEHVRTTGFADVHFKFKTFIVYFLIYCSPFSLANKNNPASHTTLAALMVIYIELRMEWEIPNPVRNVAIYGMFLFFS